MKTIYSFPTIKLKIVILFALFTLAATITVTVNLRITQAEPPVRYARILDEQTIFYADPGCSMPKFVLPYGYFVKILSEGETSIAVRYMDDSSNLPSRDGFILATHYYPYTDGEVKSPYPDCSLKLTADEVIFSDSTATTPKAVLPANGICAFYGYWEVNGESYYCVYSSGYIGYMRTKAFITADIPENPIPIKATNEEQSSDFTASDREQAENSANETTPYATGMDSAVKTVIVLAVSLVALSVVYLLFKPTKKHPTAFKSKDVDDLL